MRDECRENFVLLGLVLLVSAACAPVHYEHTWRTLNGSRADGIVKLVYEANHRTVKIPANQEQGLALAKKRCAAWGYQSAESFDYVSKSCVAYGKGARCVSWRFEHEYQCTRPKDGQYGTGSHAPNNINVNVNIPNQTAPAYNTQGERPLKPF